MANQLEKKRHLKEQLNLGNSYMKRQSFAAASENFQKAPKLADELKDLNEANLHLGQAYRFNNQFQMTNVHHDKALEIESEREDKACETDAYLELGHSYTQMNQTQTAIEYYEKALEIAREREDKANETNAWVGLGDSYRKKNQIQMAIEYYEKALEIARERKDTECENIVWGAIERIKGTKGKSEKKIIMTFLKKDRIINKIKEEQNNCSGKALTNFL